MEMFRSSLPHRWGTLGRKWQSWACTQAAGPQSVLGTPSPSLYKIRTPDSCQQVCWERKRVMGRGLESLWGWERIFLLRQKTLTHGLHADQHNRAAERDRGLWLLGEVSWDGPRAQRGCPLIGARLILWYREGRQRKRARMTVAGSFGERWRSPCLQAPIFSVKDKTR